MGFRTKLRLNMKRKAVEKRRKIRRKDRIAVGHKNV